MKYSKIRYQEKFSVRGRTSMQQIDIKITRMNTRKRTYGETVHTNTLKSGMYMGNSNRRLGKSNKV